jgi:hypothetical protein
MKHENSLPVRAVGQVPSDKRGTAQHLQNQKRQPFVGLADSIPGQLSLLGSFDF